MNQADRRTVLVTGASRGIGRAVAEVFGSRGAAVVVNYHRSDVDAQKVVAAVEGAGGQAIAVRGDIAVASDVERLYRRALQEFGSIDVVVNNAGIVRGAPFEHLEKTTFDELIGVNLEGVFLSSKLAATHVSDGGRIINIGARIPAAAVAFLGVYAAAKHGIEALTRSLAHQLGHRGVTVNAVAPGPTDTDMLMPEARHDRSLVVDRTPLGRLGRPADIAKAVALLASEEASWINGQIIGVDGGFE